MATVTQLRPTREPAPKTPSNLKQAIGVRKIGKTVARLLRLGLNKYELRLNSQLITELEDEFHQWLENERREIASQLKNVPQHAKQTWLEERFQINDRRRPENQPLRLFSDFLFQFVQSNVRQLDRLRNGNIKFRNAFSKVRGKAEREKLVLNYASELGARPSQLKADAKAFSRWFDEEAVTDRFAKRVGKTEMLLTFVFDRMSVVIDRVFFLANKYHLESTGPDVEANRMALHLRLRGIWRRLNIEGRIHDALVYDGDDRVHVAVLKCLGAAISRLPDDLGTSLLDPRTLVFIRRAAIEEDSDVWIQSEALSILAALSFSQALPVLRQRIERPYAGDDIFVRRHALKLLEEQLLRCLETDQVRTDELPSIEHEQSPFVRQKFAKVAFLSTHPDAARQWIDLALNDPIAQVRAATLLSGIEAKVDLSTTMDYLDIVERCLKSESNAFVLRTALHCLVELLDRTTQATEDRRETCETVQAFYRQRIVPQISHLQSTAEETTLRRWAAQYNEQIWALLDDQANTLIKELRPLLQKTRAGHSCRLPGKLLRSIPPEKLGRVLSVLSQDDFGYDVHKGITGYRILRGPTFGFRLWRLIHEFRQTATDKRQALRHTVGRISHSTLRAPSQILGELSETKVPGEPLTIAEDGTWRPFLPLPDDFVSVLNLSWLFRRTVRFFTSQGVTSVTGPRGIFRRLQAAWHLNFRFAELASRRNWNDDSYAATAYVEAMRKIGFEIKFAPHPKDIVAKNDNAVSAENSDQTITRFFSACMAAIPLIAFSFDSSIWKNIQRFSDYFGSAFENSLEELVLFAGAILLLVVAKHFYANYTFRKARQKIPISVGGWGTRGKSGTERLKAALIGVMGHGLVSKTTGCEAMFIHSNPHGEPLEIPLFRPYDKATIWEQRNLIRMAAKMEPSVFLWECMALTPSYVDVLQRQWTCDDIGTITNTYPDHEDVQGPAGHNVAKTISGFVPLNSHLISTEQVMRPYVTESCRLANTSFRGIGWLESGLITEDILDRFPYKEHPDNIALVASMGELLGRDYEFCLKAMADYLVPDLGVLKTHPVSEVRTRRIEFTNGMSANERFGCMGNWRRLRFDKQDPWTEPATWVTGVVNNRDDRVPRSKVFAKICVEDINADRFFLIGNNLKGLRGFIEDAWTENAKTISLRDKGDAWNTEFALKALKQAAWNFRQPIEPSHVQAKLRNSIEAILATLKDVDKPEIDDFIELWNEPERVRLQLELTGASPALIKSLLRHQIEWTNALVEFSSMESAIKKAASNQSDSLESQFVQLLKKWYDRKIVVIEDYDATGEEVIATIIDETPPGFINRTMGLQNIKGTGLDFVYRFQAWDICNDACGLATANQVQAIEKGLQSLVSMPVIGQLCQNRIREVIRTSRENSLCKRAELATLLEQLERKLFEVVGEEQDVNPTQAVAYSSNKSRSELNAWLMDNAEQFFDVHDSIRRRNLADLIYKDLASERISRQRAVVELRKINKRQKGGWLAAKLSK